MPMDLASGSPYWMLKNAQTPFRPPLQSNHRCDVLIVGAGVTAALVARELIAAGRKVTLVDRRLVAWGSTSASTALLQYEIDVELQALAKQFGIEDAVLAYRSCEAAVHELLSLARRYRAVQARPMRSLYYSSHWYHDRRLRREAELRRAHGFELECVDREALGQRFGLEAGVGLVSSTAGEIDPVQLTRSVLDTQLRKGAEVYERTGVLALEAGRRDVVARLSSGHRIRARHVIIAAGYESQTFLPGSVARNRSTYAFVSDPLPGEGAVLDDCLVWESARPYLYVRSTLDRRLIVGGEDDAVDIPARRDASLPAKVEALHRKLSRRFPDLDLNPAFGWAGTFAETEDGLPWFGPHEKYGPRVHFAMAYGGNGITFSLIGARIIRAALEGAEHPCTELFSFARKGR